MSRAGILARSVIVSACLAASCVGVAQAQEVDQVITGGALTASIADASLTPLTYSNAAQVSTGTLNLSASDARGVGTGWNVTVSATDFIYTGASPIGVDIPSTGFQTTGASPVTVVAGQAAPLPTAGAFGTLDSARKVLAAAASSGSGSYTVGLDVSLDFPAQSQTGTYTSTLTVSINDGP